MTYPKQAPPIQRPNPLRPRSLIWPHQTLDMEYRSIETRVIEDRSQPKDPTTGQYPLKQVRIASGKRLIGVRVDLMNGANFNDPAPYEPLSYARFKSS